MAEDPRLPEAAPAALQGLGPWVEVAVPLPLPNALTYSVPESLRTLGGIGSRVRVHVGRRRLVGMVVGLPCEAPPGVELRAIDDVLDLEPILPAELLRLARFITDYYQAPIGETLRAMVPRDLPSWGIQTVRLTRSGAFATQLEAPDRALVELLMERGRMKWSELAAATGGAEALERVASLRERGLIATDSRSTNRKPRGARYRNAVELIPGVLEEQLEKCGRSAPARSVVRFLDEAGRPASSQEICQAVGCGPGVVSRLQKLGLLRSFTQVERLDLDHHRISRQERPEIQLNRGQAEAVRVLEEAVSANSYAAFLLQGMTASGKTEVYLRAVDKVLSEGRTAILLVPEIGLVPSLAAAARERFGERLAMLHSGLSNSERAQEWERARSGEARVVLGPRSAILAPIRELGLVVVDEEQDSSYKQESTPRYNGRDVAMVRAQLAGAVVVLASATPSLEARLNVEREKLGFLVLDERVGFGELPQGELVDLRQEAPASRRPGEIHFSARLLEAMEETLRQDQQIILLRNRRGYAPVLLCRACGEDLRCEQCGLPRTFHKRDRNLVCHYCGSSIPKPRVCPTCSEDALDPIGSGTERVEERLKELFPEIPIDVLDRDAARRAGGATAVLERFGLGETRILVGTQMVSKGHHFPNVTLTGVLSADSYLGFPDFRAVEKTYSLLTQLAGRAGRGHEPGRVIIQTHHPEHYAIQAALQHDDERFRSQEMHFRRVFHYPPYTRMIQMIFRGTDRRQTRERILRFSERVRHHPRSDEVRIAGPAPAPLERLQGQWRFQMLLRHPSARCLREILAVALEGEKQLAGVVFDVDPQDLF